MIWRDDALHLLGAIRGIDQPRMNIHRLTARDESVDRRIIDQDDFDIVGFEPGRLDQRRRNLVEERLGLGIAQNALRGDRLRREHGGSKEGNEAGEQAHRRVA